jgi:hypothetical protein
MSNKPHGTPAYAAPVGGGYSVDEQLAAQQGQTHPVSGKPLHEHHEVDAPGATSTAPHGEPDPDDDENDEPTDQADEQGDGASE